MIHYLIFDFSGALATIGIPEKLVSGARDLLKPLALHYQLFMASAISTDVLRMSAERYKIASYFTEILGGPENKIRVVADLLERYALPPAEGVLIGDGIIDLEAAQRNGLKFLAVANDAYTKGWFMARGAVTCLHSVKELPQALERLAYENP